MSFHGAELRGSVRKAMSPDDLTDEQTGQVVRAAMAYAGKSLAEVAKESGVEYDALRNYRGPARITRAPLEKRLAIGRACGVPEWFMEGGFANAPTTADDQRETLRRLVEQARATEGRLLLLEAVARRQIDASSRSTGGHSLQGPPP